MANKCEIEGVDEALQRINEFPFECKKIIKKAIRETGNAMRKEIRGGMPYSSFRSAVRVVVKESKSGTDYTKVGIFKSNSSSSGGIPAFFKAYWLNYGTLQNRDKNHHFENAIKSQSRDKKGGIKPRGFFEAAVDGKEAMFQNVFIKSIERQTQKQ
jgi:Bacteriophage protein of unknown function (DUF646).